MASNRRSLILRRPSARGRGCGLGWLCAPAFSLIELLVVVGIIILLLAILLPALSSVKIQSYRTKTTAELKGISTSCEAYQSMFGFYPGPIREIDVAKTDFNATASAGPPIAQTVLSGTQNMAYGLLGTLTTTAGTAGNGIANVTLTNAATGGTYGMNVYGANSATGPVDLGNANKQYAQFYSPKTGDYQPVPTGGGDPNLLPTLWDQFADPLPILYLRRTPNVDGTAVNTQNAAQIWTSTTQSAYLAGTNYEYWNCSTLKSTSGAIFDETNSAKIAATSMKTGTWDGGSPANQLSGPGPYPEGVTAAWSAGGTLWNLNTSYGVGRTTGYGNSAFICTVANTNTAPVAGANWSLAPATGGFMLISAAQSRLYGNTDNIVVMGGQ